MLGDIPELSLMRNFLPKDQEPEFYPHSLDIMKAVVKLGNVSLSDSIATTDYQHQFLQY